MGPDIAYVLDRYLGEEWMNDPANHEVWEGVSQIPEEELKTSKNFMMGTLLGDLDGPFQVAGRWKSLILNGFTEEYFYRSIDTIKKIQPVELQELANKYLKPADFYELAVF